MIDADLRPCLGEMAAVLITKQDVILKVRDKIAGRGATGPRGSRRGHGQPHLLVGDRRGVRRQQSSLQDPEGIIGT